MQFFEFSKHGKLSVVKINRISVAALILLLLSIILSSCVSSGITTSLIIQDVEIANRLGAKAKLYISAHKMPDGGVASIGVNVQGLSWDPEMIKVLDIKGLNGFTVLAKSFDNTKGLGGFAAANPSTGLASGKIIEITIKRVFPSEVTSTGIEIARNMLTLGDANNNKITNYSLVKGEARVKE